MITSPENYQIIFDEIQNSTSLEIRMVNEDTEPKFIIDADARYINVPEELNTIGVFGDHNAETVYFEIDRMFDTQDFSLTDLTCVVQYKNALGIEYVYPVTTLYLVQTEEEVPSKINFAWKVSGNVTAAPGTVDFSIRFYKLDSETKEFLYNFNTQTATVAVADGLLISQENEEYNPPSDDILQALQDLKKLISEGGGSGGTNNYVDLENKPRIDGIELSMNSTSTGLGLLSNSNFFNFFNTESNVTQLKNILDFNDFLTQQNIDSALLPSSTNAVQNKVITAKINEMQKAIDESAYIPIEINSFTNTANIIEKGNKITSVTFNYSFNQTPNILTLDGVNIPAGSNTYVKSGLSLTTDTTFILTASDKKAHSVSAETSIKFLNGVYYGAAEEPDEYNSAFILTLNKNLQNNNKIVFEVDAPNIQYIYYCTPTAYEEPKLSVSGLIGGFEKVQTINFTNSNNYTESYDIYRSEYNGLGLTTVKVE